MHHQGRTRINPINASMMQSARSRDPRLMRMRPQPTNASVGHQVMQQQPPHIKMSMPGGPLTRVLPRIPKFSQSNNNKNEDRDPRNRRNKDKVESKSSKSSPNSKDKAKSSPSTKSSSSSSRSRDHRMKSGSSDDSSPRKKNEDEKKSLRSSSSHHRSSKNPSKTSINESQAKDIDLRVLLGPESSMKPDSTTSLIANSKSNKDKLLSDLLNGDELKSSHEMITSDNGKENKSILVVAINAMRFIVTIIMWYENKVQ